MSFYRLPKLETFEGWARRAPTDAVVTVKASRYLTHIKRLGAARLGRPAHVASRRPRYRLDRSWSSCRLTCRAGRGARRDPRRVPAGVRLAVEPRHDSWWTDEVREILTTATLHWCGLTASKAMGPLWRTADWGYLRMHEGAAAAPVAVLREGRVDSWAGRLQETYGDDPDASSTSTTTLECAAIDNAITFGQALDRLGLARTRVPAERPALSKIA